MNVHQNKGNKKSLAQPLGYIPDLGEAMCLQMLCSSQNRNKDK